MNNKILTLLCSIPLLILTACGPGRVSHGKLTGNRSFTPPDPFNITRVTPYYTNKTSIGFSLNQCDTYGWVYLSENSTTPGTGNVTWSDCGSFSYTYTLATTVNELKTIYAWGKTRDNGIKALTSQAVVFDNISPVIAFTNTPNAYYKDGNTATLTWTTTELNTDTTLSQSIEFYNGSTWSKVDSVTSTLGPLSAKAFSDVITISESDTQNAKWRINFTDLAGNNTLAESASFIVDSTPPSMSFINAPVVVAGGSTYTLIWSDTEANATSSNSFLVELFDGTSWSTVATTANTSGTHSATLFTANISIPLVNTSLAKVRVSSTDLIGNSATLTSSAFIIDSIAPTSSAFTINADALYTSSPSVSLTYSVGAETPTTACFQESSVVASCNWVTYTASPKSFTLTSVEGSHTVYMWVRDAATNVSTVQSHSIILDTINPTDPTSVILSNSTTGSDSAYLSWSLSTDTNLSTQRVKICTASDCATGCVQSTATSYAAYYFTNLTNNTTYYGCARGEDLAGRTSNYVVSNAVSILTPNLSVTPSSYNYGTLYTGTSSSLQNFVFSNASGAGNAIRCSTSLSTNSSADFTIVNNDCPTTGSFPDGLLTSTSCTIGVRANANSASPGTRTASLNYTCGMGLDTFTTSVSLSFTAAQILVGTDVADTITGSSGPDTIYGKYGGDTINGGAGNDVIYPGDDVWTINASNLGAYYDVTNRESIAVDSSGVVQQLNDLSGNGLNLVTNGTLGPTYLTNATTGRASISFASTNALQRSSVLGSSLFSSTEYEAVGVFMQYSTSNDGILYRWDSSGAGTNIVSVYLSYNDSNLYMDFQDSGAGHRITGARGGSWANNWMVLDAVKSSSGTATVFSNYTSKITGTSNGTLDTTQSSTFYLGLSGATNFLGSLSEIYFYKRALTSSQTFDIQKHLSSKYGILLNGYANGLSPDTLTGGSGADTFVFTNNSYGNGTTITDFSIAESDVIYFKGHSEKIRIIGSAAFSAKSDGIAEVRWSGSNPVSVQVDWAGDGVADWTIYLTGSPALTTANIVADNYAPSSGADTYYGGPDGSVMVGGYGADTLVGGPGNDTIYPGHKPFTASKFPGLTLWLDALDPYGDGRVATSGGSVTTFFDKSGQGNNAAPWNTAPTYNASYNTSSQSISFNGTTQSLQMISEFENYQNTTSFVAGTTTTDLLRDYGNSTNRLYIPGECKFRDNGNHTHNVLGAAYSGGVYLYSCSLNANTARKRNSSATDSSITDNVYVPTNWAQAGTYTLSIGRDPNGGSYDATDLAEAIIYNWPLAFSEREYIEEYLSMKQNIAWTGKTAGNKVVTGGAGADTFVITPGTLANATNTLTITDFTPGTDKLDFSTFPGSFTWRDTAAFSGGVRQIRYVPGTPTTVVQIDTDGDNTSEMQINLTGNLTLTGSDFILPSASNSPVTIIGGTGNDTLVGGYGGNSLNGGAGNDILYTNDTPFTATTISNLNSWFDGQDVYGDGTVFSGSALSEWADKSGNSLHLYQSVGTNQPTFASNTTGVPTFNTNGSSIYMSGAASNFTNGMTQRVMVKVVDQATSGAGIFSYYNSGQANDSSSKAFHIAVGSAAGTTDTNFMAVGGVGNTTLNSVNLMNLGVTIAPTFTGMSETLLLNGVQANALVSSSAPSITPDTTLLGVRWIGSALSTYGTNNYAEILTYSTALSASDQTKLDRYLALKNQVALNGNALAANTLTGGTGTDTFVITPATYSTNAIRTTITDFNQSESDKIDLSHFPSMYMNEGSGTGCNASTRQICFTSGTPTILQIDTDGDNSIEMEFALTGNISLTPSDFIWPNGTTMGTDGLYGTSANDTLVGGMGGDVLEGGAGNDVLYPDDMPFTASTISGMQLWLDSNDVYGDGSVFSGAAIDTWADKSGNNRNATQVTGANQPSFNTNTTAMPSLNFNGSSDYLNGSGFTFNTLTHRIVIKTNDLATDNQGIFSYYNSADPADWNDVNGLAITVYPTNNYLRLPQRNVGATPLEDIVLLNDTANYHNIGLVMDNSSSVGQSYAFKDGTIFGGGVYSDVNPIAADSYIIGARFPVATYGNINVQEIIAYNRHLTLSEQQRLDRYLAFKNQIPMTNLSFGVDTLTGGTGADTFVWTNASYSVSGTRDTITDFSQAEGDKIDLSSLGGFTWRGTAAFSGGIKQLRYVAGNPTIVEIDLDGDNTKEMEIALTGNITLRASDFILANTSTGIGADALTVTNTSAATLTGGAGGDVLTGGPGNDTIYPDYSRFTSSTISSPLLWVDGLDPLGDGSVMVANTFVPYARYVRIEDDSNAIYLAEVHVYDVSGTERAVGTAPTQSSTAGAQAATLAVDNNTGTYSQTNADASAFWQVDLTTSYQLDRITIYPVAGHIGNIGARIHLLDASSNVVATAYQDRQQTTLDSTDNATSQTYTFRYLQGVADKSGNNTSILAKGFNDGATGRYETPVWIRQAGKRPGISFYPTSDSVGEYFVADLNIDRSVLTNFSAAISYRNNPLLGRAHQAIYGQDLGWGRFVLSDYSNIGEAAVSIGTNANAITGGYSVYNSKLLINSWSYTANNGSSAYLNGALSTVFTEGNSGVGMKDTLLGANNYGTTVSFRGIINQLLFYNKVLTSTDRSRINQHLNYSTGETTLLTTSTFAADTLTGGAGADTFVWTDDSVSNASNMDVITDFSQNDGDKIKFDFPGVMVFRSGGNGTADFTGNLRQVAYQKSGFHTYVYADVDGDNVADLTIQLYNTRLTLTRNDFILPTSGTRDADIIVGTSSNDSLLGRFGGDSVSGGAGDDIIYGDDVAFTKDEISHLRLWFDAYDVNGDGTFLADSAAIATWKNKAEFRDATQTTGANQPQYKNNGTGRPYIYFDGVDDSFLVNAFNFTKMSAFVAVNYRDLTVMGGGLLSFYQAGQSDWNHVNGLAFSYHNALNNVFAVEHNNNGGTVYIVNQATSNVPMLLDFTFDKYGDANFMQGYGNGIQGHYLDSAQSTGQYVTVSLGTVAPTYMDIGSRTGNSAYVAANFNEILVFDKALSYPDASRVRQYLAGKWDLTYNDNAVLGVDTLTGGTGADIFVWSPGSYSTRTLGSRDIITDFTQSDSDKIKLTGFPTGFVFRSGGHGEADFTGGVRQVAYDATSFVGSGYTLVYVDDDGDNLAEWTIQLTGTITLTNTDFIFDMTPAGGIVTGAPGGSTLVGSFGTTTITGGTGNDTIYPWADGTLPTSYTGGTLWLDGLDVFGNGSLTTDQNALHLWVDKSGSSNDAVNATSAQQPLYAYNSSGMPSIKFDGTAAQLTGTAAAQTSDSVLVALNMNSSPWVDNTPIFSYYSTGNPDWSSTDGIAFVMGGSPQIALANNGSTNATSNSVVSATTKEMYDFTVDSAGKTTITVNGYSTVSGTAMTSSRSPTNYILGQRYPQALYNYADYYEVLAYSNVVLSSSQMNSLRLYLATKWNTTLYGYTKGNKTITGGTGADIFKWNVASNSGIGTGNRDIITDFSRSDNDYIDVSDFPGTVTFLSGGNGASDFTGTGREIAYINNGTNTVLYFDVDGDGVAERELQLSTPLNMSSTDFILPTSSTLKIKKMRINSEATGTLSATVTVSLGTEGSAVEMCLRQDTTVGSCTWVPYISSSSFTLSAPVNGTRYTIYGWVKDVSGTVSQINSSSIIYDTTTPVMTSFVINAGAPTTTSTTVSIAFTYTGNPTYICFREINDSTACSWIHSNSTPQSYTITGTPGAITIYGWMKNNAGTISAVASSSISLDNVAPTTPTNLAAALNPSNSNNIDATWTASTDGSGNLAGYHVMLCSDTACTTNCTTQATTAVASYSWTGLTSDNVYYACVRAYDTAGNTSSYATQPAPIYVNTAQLAISPTSYSFGDVAVGAQSATTTFTVSNGSGRTQAVGCSTSITTTYSSDFVITANTCVATLNAGSSCTITVKAAGNSNYTGPRYGTLLYSCSYGATGTTLSNGLSFVADQAVTGTIGPDTISVTSGNNTLIGGYDGDTISGGSGNDVIYPGDLPFTNATATGLTTWINPSREDMITLSDISSVDSLNYVSSITELSSSAYQFAYAGGGVNFPTLKRNSQAGRNTLSTFGEDRGIYSQSVTYGNVASANEAEAIFVQKYVTPAHTSISFGLMSGATSLISTHATWSDGNVYLDFGNNTTGRITGAPPAEINNAHQILTYLHRSTNVSEYYLDGLMFLSGAATAALVPSESGSIVLGGISPGVTVHGEFGDAMLFKNALSTADQDQVWSYVSQKYAIPLSGRNLGVDTLTGGGGADTFTWSNSVYTGTTDGNRAVITDFSISENDMIYFRGVDEYLYSKELLAFDASGLGEVRYQQYGNDTLIQIDWGGDGISDAEIQLSNFTATDLNNMGRVHFQKAYGGVASDVIYGDFDSDTLVGAFGGDTMNGGAGNDTIYPDMPPLNTAQKNGLVAWYNNFDINGDGTLTSEASLVSSWKDLSGNNNHLTAAGVARPTFYKNGSALPKVSFDGSNYLQFTSQPILGTTARTIFMVTNNVSTGASDGVLSLSDSGVALGRYNFGPTGILSIFTSTYFPTSYTSPLSGASHLQTYENLASTTMAQTSYWIDGGLQTYDAVHSAAGGAINTAVGNAYVGCFVPGVFYATTSVYDLMIYNRALNAKEVFILNQYLSAKNAIAVSGGTLTRDTLSGGAGADTFVFTQGNWSGIGNGNRDIILDFSQTEGDKIDLSDFPGTFTFRPTSTSGGSFTGTAREVSWYLDTAGNRTIIYVDIDGDGTAEFEIELNTQVSLTSSDFIL